jgi:hypothetical protein
MQKNEKMKCKTKGDVYIDSVTWKHKFEQAQAELELLRNELAIAKSTPMQPLIDGRFKENKMVTYCLENETDMNKLAIHNFSQEDREQFYQLIGYSLGGYADLSQVSDESYYRAEKLNN